MAFRTTILLSVAPFVLWTATAFDSSSLAPLLDETTKWSVLTYTQHYTDDQNEDITYNGTLFLQLAKVSLNDCNLKLTILVQDRFTGTLTRPQTLHIKTTDLGQTSQTFTYDYLLPLSSPLDVTIATGRPVQIEPRTGYHCAEQPACKLTWLELKLPSAQIEETRKTDGFIDFNQSVKEITLPMSSPQAAQHASAAIQALAEACRVPHP